jgi:tRNA(Arg) A34 adenosine deaminase TadA
MEFPEVVLRLPGWVGAFVDGKGPAFASIEERMRFVIELSRVNVERRTGGPFGAAVFERDSGRVVGVGVNLVESGKCSIAHAEMVAIAVAQQAVGSYDLGAEGFVCHELVTSTEPCAMCLGAIPWSGIRRVVCGARDEDARAIGFDEGSKPADWVGSLERRGIAVVRDVLREQARRVLVKYKESGGVIYNAMGGDSTAG